MDLGFGLVESLRQSRCTRFQSLVNALRASCLVWKTSRPDAKGDLIVLNPLGLNAADPGLQGPARIGDHILQGIPSPQLLGPSRARQGGGFLAQEPDHAVRLDAHQDGAAVEEDLIEASHQDQGLALGIEPFEDPAGRFASSLDPAPIEDRAGACSWLPTPRSTNR